VREVFVDEPFGNRNLLQVLKILVGLATIVSIKIWLKQEISEECTIFALISSFNLKFLSTVFHFYFG